MAGSRLRGALGVRSGNRAIKIILFAAVVLGLFAGIAAAWLFPARALDISSDVIFPSYGERLIKYGEFYLIIGLSAFLPLTAALSPLAAALKAMGFGFTTAALCFAFGADGLYYAFSTYFLREILLIALYVFLDFHAMSFALGTYLSKAGGGAPSPVRYALRLGAGAVVLAGAAMLR